MIKKVLILVILLISSFNVAFAEEVVIKHIRPESELDPRNQYFLALLRLALEKTEAADGAFKLETTEMRMYQGRAIASLERNRNVNVVWTMTSNEREEKLLPIRIPLLKGLLGHRVCLINQEDQAKFAAISTVDELKQLSAGQGHDWPDAEILRTNGFHVITAATYEGLFDMLHKQRFDYFPRGVNEAWAEVHAHSDMGFMVEETLLLHYIAPIYFFVNKENTDLAKRLERGLRQAISDGSFDELFYNHPITKEMFEHAHFEKRKIFQLYNPLLPPETPVNQEELWYHPQTQD